MALNNHVPFQPTEANVNNKGFVVNATTYAGKDLYHTSTTSTDEFEYLTLYVVNNDTADVDLYVVWQGEAEAAATKLTVPPGKPDLCFAAERNLRCGGGGYTVHFYASVADKLVIYPGFCYRVITNPGIPAVNTYLPIRPKYSTSSSYPVQGPSFANKDLYHGAEADGANSNYYDYLTIYATNTHTSDVTLIFDWGRGETEDFSTKIIVPPNVIDMKVISERLFRQGGTSVYVDAAAYTDDKVYLRAGFCYRIITP